MSLDAVEDRRRRLTSPASESPEPETPDLPECWSVQRETELVLQSLRVALDAVSQESPVPAHELENWKRVFIETGARRLKIRSDPEERELAFARAQISERMTSGLAEYSIEKEGPRGRVEEAAAMRAAVSAWAGRVAPGYGER